LEVFRIMEVSRRLYLDNAATSFPKPREVLEAMTHYAQRIGASAGRGAYAEAQASGQVIATCRQRLNELFHGENPDHFVFGLNCSDGLNLAIYGAVRPGDHVITTWMDHNSVLRPLNALQNAGVISYTAVRVDPVTCVADPDEVRRAIRPNTRLIAMVHGSNVTGTVQQVGAVGKIAREKGVLFCVDAAQTAGHYPIDVQALGIDLLAFPGHKGLLGPLGTGALYIRPGVEKQLRPQRQGGTGSVSEEAVQPEFMPDKYESGSHNAIGIAGLSAGVKWVLDQGVETLYEHDQTLCKLFMEGVDGVAGLRYFGPQGIKDRMGVFSVRIEGWKPAALAARLEEDFGILTRPGLHCAPLAHQTIGTDPGRMGSAGAAGTTRLSFGPFLELADAQYAADALSAIALENLAGRERRVNQTAS
jgi:cysteine desulfurase family protein